MKLELRVLARVLVLAVAIYVAGIAAWPAVTTPFRRVYSAAGEAFLAVALEPGEHADLDALARTGRGSDVRLELRDAAGREGTAYLNVRYRVYQPIVLLLALFLVTPLPVRRRMRALGFGLAIHVGFLAIQLWIKAWWELGPNALAPPSPGQRAVDGLADHVLVIVYYSATTAFVAPILIWAATLRLGAGRGRGPRASDPAHEA